jgi:hypothetical protein
MATNASREVLATALEAYMEGLVAEQFLAAESFAEAIAAAQASEDPVYVVFYYEIDDIINSVYMLSHYKAKNIRSQEKEPKPRLDELTLSDDEEEMLLKLVKDAARDIYRYLAPYGKDIAGGYLVNPDVTDPVEYDEDTVYNEGDLFYVADQLYYTIADATPAGTDPEDTDYFTAVGEQYNTYRKIIYTLNYDAEMDASMIEILNEDIDDALLKHVMYNWYLTIQEVPMAQLSQGQLEDAISKMAQSLHFRKTPIRRRTELI